MKSLMRMRKQPFNTNQREHANVVAVLGSQAFGLARQGGIFSALFLKMR